MKVNRVLFSLFFLIFFLSFFVPFHLSFCLFLSHSSTHLPTTTSNYPNIFYMILSVCHIRIYHTHLFILYFFFVNVHYRVYESLPLNPILSYKNQFHNFLPYLLMIHFKIIPHLRLIHSVPFIHLPRAYQGHFPLWQTFM